MSPAWCTRRLLLVEKSFEIENGSLALFFFHQPTNCLSLATFSRTEVCIMMKKEAFYREIKYLPKYYHSYRKDFLLVHLKLKCQVNFWASFCQSL
jgi:hypothetical protein